MLFVDLMVAVISALGIVWIISVLFNTKGPWGNLFWFFVVVALFAWSCGVWIVPVGPQWRGTGWLPIICMGILIALLLVAASPRTSRKRLPRKEQEFVDVNAAIDVFLWICMVCLLMFGIGHYVWHPRIG